MENRCEACDRPVNPRQTLCAVCTEHDKRAHEAERLARGYRIGWDLPDSEQPGING